MSEGNFLEIECKGKEEGGRFRKLIEILGRKDFTFAGGNTKGNNFIYTFIFSKDKTFLNEKQEMAVKELLGTDLRYIMSYQILNQKFYTK